MCYTCDNELNGELIEAPNVGLSSVAYCIYDDALKNEFAIAPVMV